MTSALLVRLGGLGDLLVALPSLRLVRAAFPEAELHLLCRPEYGGLLREAGVVDLAFSADDPKWMPLFDAEPPARLGGMLSGYDWIAGWFHGRKVAAELPFHAFRHDPASGAAISRGFFDATADVLRAFGRSPASFDDCRLLFPGDPTRRERLAVVHPGSGSPRKRWPLDRFRAVIDALREGGLDGVVVSGEAEADMGGPLGGLPLPPGWRRWTRPPLSDLARLLRAAAVYVGNDSGPTHLAAACGAATIAVFREEFAAAWAPFGRTTVVSAPSVEEVAAEDLIAVLMKVLEKAPAI
jgi:ADP-heptose:LPS heptosyltransferase